MKHFDRFMLAFVFGSALSNVLTPIFEKIL